MNKINTQNKLQTDDFERMFGEKLSSYTKKKIKDYGFRYRHITPDERDDCIKKIVDTLLDRGLVYSGKHRLGQWEKGWGENLANLKKHGNSSAIIPHYFGKYDIVRVNQKLIKAHSKNFERNSLAVIVGWLADKYMRDADSIYEFGCGTGHHLLEIRDINRNANLWGLDWVESSQKIIQKIAAQKNNNKLFAKKFDFFNPDKKFKLGKNSVIYTVAALEQVGEKFDKFIDFLIGNKPKLCIHVEPIGELLDENNLLDFLSLKYFEKRNYLKGFLSHLYKLEKQNKIKILKAQRSYIGSFFIDGYSVIVWSPR
ncbi:hypothetical protein A2303_04720 [Candidatus Falkowbacteria bacterium RIFOXYB2_FULL_47_14]|uniref:Methyltransferase domain-containing protein n=1 Tax=Candidatus Falkowbacteria bacterium RIFOXYA2_FULL_47_19 TaxID=1797994 RepID=A0A1F5SHA7_9BACT|nr:MAG: hypothetical protein A2227_02555 [Candidatus Falkowbacteria bacterium RIFOXYA2_FULL_47_19]OGF35805.1 MAG: hypothetical protein A2468_03740 [Candidatus Falkowbacteria bacterium RIFOXYC2_FULL_46_15]OGF42678.1 MAG: hypothetical protein A2303_04720 [Candidatus Falkowbacteria bacterium RIFOXYB2_FULL_47_14]